MATTNEMSSSLNFASSSYVSNGCTSQNVSVHTNFEYGTSPENLSLTKLSCNLENLLVDPEYDYTDAVIVVEDIPVNVHRCVLAARSQFFHELLKKESNSSMSGDKPRYLMSELVPYGSVGYEAFNVFLHYLYTGKLKPSPPEVSTCVDDGCEHDACRPAINYAVELMYASAVFQIKELVLLSQRHLLNFVEKALIEDVIPILLAAVHCQLDQLLSHCIERVVKSDLDSVCIEKELPLEVSNKIKLLQRNSQNGSETAISIDAVEPANEKNIRRIHKALDSDDVELVKLLLDESNITLNDAYALHYAVAYSTAKVVKEVLGLGLADINLRNSRGYSVLHVAARRKEPSVLAALLTKGVCVSEITSDGQSAVAICRRLIRPKDYNENTKQGQKTNNDRLCITILEREMHSVSVNMSISSHIVFDDRQRWLSYLEDRVALARMLFPSEARVAMEVADADSTTSYGLSTSKSKCSNENLREVDLNEAPSIRNKRIQLRVEALYKTVEMGRHYFPHCSEVIDKFLTLLDDDMSDTFFLEKGTSEEQKMKKKRFTELKEDVQKAFYKDIAESNWSSLSSSSSSSCSPKKGVGSRSRRKC